MPEADLGVVIVTGGASGLGRAVAAAVAAEGGHPVVLDVQRPDEEREAVLVDLADGRAAEEAVRGVGERHGRIDAVVTAAGIDACGDLADVAADAWERVIAVNLVGTAAVVRAALPWLLDGRGRVVTVASTLALRALPAATAYCASKFGVLGFSRALAAETAGRIGVTTLIPGGMRTAFFDDRDPQFKPGPDAVLNDPADVARAVVFALRQPPGCEVREMLVAPAVEPSWP
ncbi:MAG TPA: SDR family oxidoreductase [Miltoncostaeaceae bacterium]|nr:SDR family oxidoreductase [Miltoncostaeaceae bacterium]